jgi:hypothetical protein
MRQWACAGCFPTLSKGKGVAEIKESTVTFVPVVVIITRSMIYSKNGRRNLLAAVDLEIRRMNSSFQDVNPVRGYIYSNYIMFFETIKMNSSFQE